MAEKKKLTVEPRLKQKDRSKTAKVLSKAAKGQKGAVKGTLQDLSMHLKK